MPPVRRVAGLTLAGLALAEGGARLLRDGTSMLRDSATETGHRLKAQAAGSPVGERLQWHPRWGWQPLKGGWDGVAVDEAGVRVMAASGPAPVLILGDERSFETGSWVDDLRCDCTPLNLAAPGYGLDQLLLRYVEQGLRASPQVVVLALDTAALVRVRTTWDLWRKPRFGFADGKLYPPAGNAPRPEAALQEGRWLAGLDLVDVALQSMGDPVSLRGADDPLVHTLLDGLAAEVEASGARLVTVWLPSDHPDEADGEALVRAWAGAGLTDAAQVSEAIRAALAAQ